MAKLCTLWQVFALLHGGRYGPKVPKNHLLQTGSPRLQVCMHKLKMAAEPLWEPLSRRHCSFTETFSVAWYMLSDSTNVNLMIFLHIDNLWRPNLHKIQNGRHKIQISSHLRLPWLFFVDKTIVPHVLWHEELIHGANFQFFNLVVTHKLKMAAER